MGEDLIDDIMWFKELATSTEQLDDEIIVNNNSEIKLEVDYPYLIFSRNDLIRAMNLCSKIVQNKSDMYIYNSLSFVVGEGNSLNLYATNELSHFKMTIELIGDTKEFINSDFCISLNILQKLVKLMGNKVLIYLKDNKYYIRLLNGDLLIDARPVDIKIVKFPGEEQGKLADINISNIGSIVNAMLPLLQTEIRSDAKKILFTGEKAYFKSSFYYIEANITSPSISLSYRDAEFINKLYKYYKDTQISLFRVSSTVPRLLIKLNNIYYQFLNPVNSESNLMTKQMEGLIKNTESLVEFNNFNRIVNLATTLPDSTGNIELKYSGDKLEVILTSSKGTSNFTFDIDKQGTLYKKSVLIRAELLRKLLASFTGADKIGIALTDLSINIEYKNIKAVMMHNI